MTTSSQNILKLIHALLAEGDPSARLTIDDNDSFIEVGELTPDYLELIVYTYGIVKPVRLKVEHVNKEPTPQSDLRGVERFILQLLEKTAKPMIIADIAQFTNKFTIVDITISLLGMLDKGLVNKHPAHTYSDNPYFTLTAKGRAALTGTIINIPGFALAYHYTTETPQPDGTVSITGSISLHTSIQAQEMPNDLIEHIKACLGPWVIERLQLDPATTSIEWGLP